jgi:hypothetical protein
MTIDKTGTLLLVLLIFSLSPASALECPLPQKVTEQGALKESRETIEQRAQLRTAQVSSAIPSLVHALRKKFPTSTDAEITDYLITAYCPVLNQKAELSDDQRKAQLEQFGDQVRGDLP